MVAIQTFLMHGGVLVPVEAFVGPILDEDYVEGAIELSIRGRILLTRDQVDYVDQLWAYLVEGLGEVTAGREFSTYFPDTAIKVVLRPMGERVLVHVDRKVSTAEATTTLRELRAAMVPAGILFFEQMRPFMTRHQGGNDRALARLRVLGR